MRDNRLRSCTGRQGIALCGVALTTWMSEQSEHFLDTDPNVFAAEVKGFGDGEHVRVYLDMIRAQALLLAGAAEDPEGQAAKVASLLPAVRAVTLPDLGHAGAFLASGRALPHAPQTLRESLAY